MGRGGSAATLTNVVSSLSQATYDEVVIYCYILLRKKDLIRFRERSEQELSTGEADLQPAGRSTIYMPPRRPVAKRPVAPSARPLNSRPSAVL